MKHLVLALLAAAVLAAAPVATAQAQMGADEIDQLMKQIRDQMRELEQDLAKASLDPADTEQLMEMLKRAVDSGDTTSLPPELQDFLRNNPDVLGKLAAPEGATAEEQRAVEESIREMLKSDDGVQKLLEENPELLQKLLDDQDALTEALKNHVRVEDDIKRLFEQANQTMRSTEQQLKDLIELAEQMQQQQQGQGQPQDGNPMEQPGEQPGGEQGERPQHQEGNQDNQNPAPDEYQAPPSQTGGAQGTRDPRAWNDVTPTRDQGDRTASANQPNPNGYDEDWEALSRALGEAASGTRRNNDSGSGTGSDSGSGSND